MYFISKKLKYLLLLIETLKLIRNRREYLLYKYFGKKSAIIKLKNNLVFHINEPISLWALGEVFVSEDYKLNLKSVKVILDIGAHIGISTLYFSINYPGCKIFAYEPSSANFKYLSRNIQTNKLTNVKTFLLAVSDIPNQKVKLIKSANSMTSSTLKNNVKTNCVFEHVKTTNINNIININHINVIDILKIDCEGEEYNILLNIDRSIFDKIKSFAIEYHNHPQYNYTHIINILKKNHYSTCLYKSPFFYNTGIIHAYKSTCEFKV